MDDESPSKILYAEQGRVRTTYSDNTDNPMKVFDNEKMEPYDQTDLSFESIPNEEEGHDMNGGTHRGLSARHIQMISLGGCIG